jgi:hypothetical protein
MFNTFFELPTTVSVFLVVILFLFSLTDEGTFTIGAIYDILRAKGR